MAGSDPDLPADANMEWILDSSAFAVFGDCHLRFVSAGLTVEAGAGSGCSWIIDSDRAFVV